jgi:hypothetical protein
MVANMLDSFAGIVDLGLSPEDCLVYLEDQLQHVGLNDYGEVNFFVLFFLIYVCSEFAFFHFVLFQNYLNLNFILINSK